ncbi:MAG TPA: DUF2162 domain-containing protein [Deltaproteobacteria bacterium]|nr:DUF2162 domain-containing protein [Deltaproteobacteria bacterium]HQB39525.1 DUF2162 domain-containing protein [Deltaproteobacteria bacterium]
MDLNILLWIGGMLFSLGIFAVKVGLGLGCGRYGAKMIALVLTGYTLLFMLIAALAGQLMAVVAPLLQNGPYSHTILAAGLIVWGLMVILRKPAANPQQKQAASGWASLLMIIPCPVCLSAMVFSTWAALNSVKLTPLWLGLCLGLAFSAMALLVAFSARMRSGGMPQTSLGMAMITVGLYFVGSLFLPAKIEEAKKMYHSFVNETPKLSSGDTTGVMVLMLILLLVGFWASRKREVCCK